MGIFKKIAVFSACLVFVFCLSTRVSRAQTISSVSGTFSNNNTIQISGSGFGTKAVVAPYKYDNFENGIVGQTVSGWSQNNNNSVTYSTAYTRGVSTKIADHNATGGNYNMSLGMDSDFSGQIYLDFWMRVDTIDGTNNPSRNFKPWRIYGTGGGDPQVDYVIGSDGGALTNLCDGSCSTSYSSDVQKQAQWRHFQVLLKESSSAGTSDGVYRHWINGSAFGSNSTSVVTRNSTGHYGQIRIGHYWAFD